MGLREIEYEVNNGLVSVCLNCDRKECTGGINCAYEEEIMKLQGPKGGTKRRLYSETAVQMAKEGKTYREIGKQLGVSYTTIGQWCKEAGLPPRKSFLDGMRDIRKEKVVQLYNEGYTYREIATITGITKALAVKLAKEAGLPPRYQKRK